jgi:hypothetical protein
VDEVPASDEEEIDVDDEAELEVLGAPLPVDVAEAGFCCWSVQNFKSEPRAHISFHAYSKTNLPCTDTYQACLRRDTNTFQEGHSYGT